MVVPPMNRVMSGEAVTTGSDPRAVIDAISDLVFVIDALGNVRNANPAARHFIGESGEGPVDRSAFEFVHPDDLALVLSSMETVKGKDHGTPIEVRVKSAEHGWRWIEIIGSDRLDDPAIRGLVIVGRDLTQRRMWEVAAGDVTRFQQVVQHAAAVTLLLDTHGTITSVNGAFTRLLGHDPSIAVGRDLTGFCTLEDQAALRSLLDRVVVSGTTGAVEVHMRCANDDLPPRPMRFEVVNLLDDPVVDGLVATAYDVTELHTARQELEHLARHDALTGLPNRAALLDRLERLLGAHRPLAVVFVDLDDFKPVNDEFGHEAGDEVLQHVAARMRGCSRPDDLVARMGGDEFVVIATGICRRQDAERVAERIEVAIAEPYRLRSGPTVQISASTGFAVSAHDSTVNGLLASADVGMYGTKARRREDHPRLADDPERLQFSG